MESCDRREQSIFVTSDGNGHGKVESWAIKETRLKQRSTDLESVQSHRRFKARGVGGGVVEALSAPTTGMEGRRQMTHTHTYIHTQTHTQAHTH